jgi:carbonic anhydrase
MIGCGMLTFKNEDAYAIVGTNLGPEATKELGGLDFLPFPEYEMLFSLHILAKWLIVVTSLSRAVRDDVAYIRESKLVPNDVAVSGWIYDVETGKVTRVD